MPLVHWVSGFDEAAEALRQLDGNGSTHGFPAADRHPHGYDATDVAMGPPCGLSVSLSDENSVSFNSSSSSSSLLLEGRRIGRFATALDDFGSGTNARTRRQPRRRMWLELRGAAFVVRSSSSHNNSTDSTDSTAAAR